MNINSILEFVNSNESKKIVSEVPMEGIHSRVINFIHHTAGVLRAPTNFVYGVNDNAKVYQKIIQKYTTSTECCKGTKSLLYITYC